MFSLVLFSAFAFSDYSDPGTFEAKSYDDAKVLRVKYTQGEAYITRSYDEGFEEAAINLPIFEKDIAGTTDGRLEVYLGRLNYLRLDYDTEVNFDKVPELRKTGMSFRLIKGGIYLDIENLDFERDIEIQTPDCGIFLLDKGLYRINVNEGGRTELYVYDGIAEVSGENYNRNVRENQKIVMFDGRVKERPFYFYSSDADDFDRWNRERNQTVGYARYSSSRYLDEGYGEYEYELSRNGRWRYDSTYGTNIWIPYNVGDDWRPYYRGRWVWSPNYGYVWTSFDSWGFFTHHYGRWHWDPIYHWCWVPGYRWSPAWVSWFWDDYYYGWSPLSWWNRPIVVYNGRWWRNYHYRHGVPFHARSTTIIRKGQLSSAGVHRVALTRGAAGKISKKSIVFRGNAPGVRPMYSKVNVINARGKNVTYKKSGIISTTRYKIAKTGSVTSKMKVKSNVVYKYSSPGKKVSKEKTWKYSQSPYTKRSSVTTKVKSKSYKYKPSTSSTSSTSSKTRKYGTSRDSVKSRVSTSGSTSKYKARTSSSSKTKKSSSKSKSSSGKKVKKKKESPSYSYYAPSSSKSYSSSSSSKTTSRTGNSYSSKKKSYSSYSYPKKSQSSYKTYGNKSNNSYYKPSTSSRKQTASSSSSSYKSSYTPRSSYSKPSSSSYSKPSSSYKSSSKSSYTPRSSYSKPSSSYKSSYKSSSSYSKPSSSYKSSSTSRSSSSYKRSSRSSSSSKRSSSKSSSSSRSNKKKN